MKNKKVLKKEKRKYLSEYQNHLLRESNLFKNLKYRGVSVAIIALFSFSLYINTFNADYALDDLMLITKNKFTLQGINGIKDILTNDMSVGYFGRKINKIGRAHV